MPGTGCACTTVYSIEPSGFNAAYRLVMVSMKDQGEPEGLNVVNRVQAQPVRGHMDIPPKRHLERSVSEVFFPYFVS